MIVLAYVAVLLVACVLSSRAGARMAREDERDWERTIERIRARSGKCPTCGNLRCPMPTRAAITIPKEYK